MVGKIIVKFGSYGADHGQSPSRDFWEIMMLVVIPNVPTYQVQRAIIRICLNSLYKYIMFSYEMAGHRVKSHPQKCRFSDAYT